MARADASVYRTDCLGKPFVRIAGGLATGTFTDVVLPGCCFYRIEVELDVN
ncbi:hypothetical protein PDESU_00312 [Pontiella desulfatans]|uniref:Uncharacterized protein n=1 Tax=Pontiella desulfatans TaxID=2750659 RepID=A0A6C2TWT9_PONDE|nr:hypothetical protein [Pontiella desulfatans]VGO11766.1 hypothetical protein PDESU_00312 [Pontiella desulfatans]